MSVSAVSPGRLGSPSRCKAEANSWAASPKSANLRFDGGGSAYYLTSQTLDWYRCCRVRALNPSGERAPCRGSPDGRCRFSPFFGNESPDPSKVRRRRARVPGIPGSHSSSRSIPRLGDPALPQLASGGRPGSCQCPRLGPERRGSGTQQPAGSPRRPRPLLSASAPGLPLASTRLTFQLADPASPAESQLSEGWPPQPPAHCSRRPAPSPLCEAGRLARPAVLQRWRAQPPGAPAVLVEAQERGSAWTLLVTPYFFIFLKVVCFAWARILSCVCIILCVSFSV